MTDHYAEAERHLKRSFEAGHDAASRDRLIARAHVHALLAAIPRTTTPIVVSAPAELIEQIKVTPPAGLHGGVLFIPDEMNFGEGGGEAAAQELANILIEQIKHPLDPQESKEQ